jgi:hypothetical protein
MGKGVPGARPGAACQRRISRRRDTLTAVPCQPLASVRLESDEPDAARFGADNVRRQVRRCGSHRRQKVRMARLSSHDATKHAPSSSVASASRTSVGQPTVAEVASHPRCSTTRRAWPDARLRSDTQSMPGGGSDTTCNREMSLKRGLHMFDAAPPGSLSSECPTPSTTHYNMSFIGKYLVWLESPTKLSRKPLGWKLPGFGTSPVSSPDRNGLASGSTHPVSSLEAAVPALVRLPPCRRDVSSKRRHTPASRQAADTKHREQTTCHRSTRCTTTASTAD